MCYIIKCCFMQSRLGESIKKLARRARRHPGSLLAWFDDAGAIKLGDGYIVVKVDGFAASRALYPWCSFRDFGFRGVTAAVSDIVAKGCRPYVYAVSIGVKPEHVDLVEDIFRGVEEAVDFYGGYVENMDTNVGYDDWIDVFVVGECGTQPVQRFSKPLDTLVLPRRIGFSAIGYMEYSRGRAPIHEDVREFTCRPRACVEVADVIEECRTCIEGSIDISDTFAEALQQLSDVSNTGFYIFQDPSNILHYLALDYAAREKIDRADLVLMSSEEYIPLLVVRPGYEKAVASMLRSIGLEAIPIGVATIHRDITWMGRPIPSALWDYISGRITKSSSQ